MQKVKIVDYTFCHMNLSSLESAKISPNLKVCGVSVTNTQVLSKTLLWVDFVANLASDGKREYELFNVDKIWQKEFTKKFGVDFKEVLADWKPQTKEKKLEVAENSLETSDSNTAEQVGSDA